MRVVIVSALVLGFAGVAYANENVDARAANIARGVMSPFCPGHSLYTCSSGRAELWRTDIKQWLGAGLSRDEIVARLQARVPEFDMSGDPAGAWYWGIPLAALLLASALVARVAVRSRPRPAVPRALAEEDPEFADLLDDELSLLDC